MASLNKSLLQEYTEQAANEEELRANDDCCDACVQPGGGCSCCDMSGDDQCECCGEMGCLACMSM